MNELQDQTKKKMLQVENENYYSEGSLEFRKGDVSTYPYQAAHLQFDNFTENQSCIRSDVVDQDFRNGEQYIIGDTAIDSNADTSVLNSSCELTQNASNLTGEQIFQEAMRYVQEQSETPVDNYSSTYDYNWENRNPKQCKL